VTLPNDLPSAARMSSVVREDREHQAATDALDDPAGDKARCVPREARADRAQEEQCEGAHPDGFATEPIERGRSTQTA